VSLLNVSLIILKTLEEDALLSYESVRYLYLQHCKIFNINEKALQRLENLAEVDLSSNRLTSISPNLFNGNQKLDKLILQNNNFGILQWNTPIPNGPPSTSSLDLQSCRLSNISSITFSLLLNLTFLDISNNRLVLLNNDTLSSHEKLKDVNLENNPLQCGAVFEGLLCSIHTKLTPSYNRTVTCHYLNGTHDIWSPQNWSSLCDSESTQLVTSSHQPDISTSMKPNLTSTPSHELDISTSTTLNPKVSHNAEPGTKSALLFFGMIFVVLSLLVSGLICVCKKYSSQYREHELLLSHSENAT
jgi:Leucine-rich repeat (LRR) protein